MKGVEKITHTKKLVALIIRNNIQVQGVKFFTEEKNPFQVGLHQRLKGVKIKPHLHKIDKPLTVKSVQEILFLVEGKIKVTIYTKTGQVISRKVLRSGDSILFLSHGHGVDFLENSKIFEVKQGPYPGAKYAKLYFKGIVL